MNKDFARGMIVSMALKALPVRKKSPIAYLYNGVRLPKLPEWDREAYPYAWIYTRYSLGIKAFTRLIVSSAPFYFHPDNIVENGEEIAGEFIMCTENHDYLRYDIKWNKDETDWALAESGNADYTRYQVLASGFTYRDSFWTNYYIMEESGAITFAPMPITPVYADETQGEPYYLNSSYLYGGVKMPILPEWDKTVYPYALINGALYSATKTATLYLVTSLEYETISSNGGRGLTLSEDNHIRYSGSATGTEWEKLTASTGPLNIKNIKWSNTDILNADGSVYLAASEPVPVYE